jgi:hypothetical protein
MATAIKTAAGTENDFMLLSLFDGCGRRNVTAICAAKISAKKLVVNDVMVLAGQPPPPGLLFARLFIPLNHDVPRSQHP